jgi:hypothetical protein
MPVYNSDHEELPSDWFNIMKQPNGEYLLQQKYPTEWKAEKRREKRKQESNPEYIRAMREDLELKLQQEEREEKRRKDAAAHHEQYLRDMSEAKDQRRKAKAISEEEFEYWNQRCKQIELEDVCWRQMNGGT